MVDGVAHRHTLEVIDLATGEDGRQNLVLLSGGENEDDVCRGLLKGLQERVEGRCGEHVHLVDDKDLVFAYLRRDACLFHQRLDVFYAVVRGSVELKDVE